MPVTFRQAYDNVNTVVGAVTGFTQAREPISPTNEPNGTADAAYSIEMAYNRRDKRTRTVGYTDATITVRWLRRVTSSDHNASYQQALTDGVNIFNAMMDSTDSNLAAMAMEWDALDIVRPAGSLEWFLGELRFTSSFYTPLS